MTVLESIRDFSKCPATAGDAGFGNSIRTIDLHTGGEPLRVILSGYPDIEGDDVLAKRRFVKKHLDHLRTRLMFEPRGHADMYGCLLVEPNDDDADFGALFLHNEGYSTMCGHAIIAISKLVFQMGWKQTQENHGTLKIDAPCGRIVSFTDMSGELPGSVRFHCVPSFVAGLNRIVDVEGLGAIEYDLAYGGAFYAYVDLRSNRLGFELEPAQVKSIIDAGIRIKHAVARTDKSIVHPFENDLGFLYGTIFIADSEHPDRHSKNVCVFADGEVDRCPTGSGVSGRMAIHYAKGEVSLGQSIQIESITGSVFSGKVVESTTFGPHSAVVPEVAGTAYVTGTHSFITEPDDPLQDGFLLR